MTNFEILITVAMVYLIGIAVGILIAKTDED